MKRLLFLASLCFFIGCRKTKKENTPTKTFKNSIKIGYAKGFSVEKLSTGVTVITVTKPWQNANTHFTYALIPKEKQKIISLNKNEYDAIIPVPIESMVATSTTHIPSLEALEVLNTLKGFPDTKYISSKEARSQIKNGNIQELGKNETLNTEAVLALQPEMVVGFSISTDNASYLTLQRSNIPVVYNGDWVEETPLGKAEWIKFFAPFFGKEKLADSVFKRIETAYLKSKELAKKAKYIPTVLGGAMYKDVWFLPGGNSWAANFIKDANADYLWKETTEKGSLSLSWENVLSTAQTADYWIGPGQFTTYHQLREASLHYTQFDAFKNRTIFTFSNTLGETGGVLYYELAPHRPDLVLRDLIHIFHPDILPDHKPFFFKPVH